MGNLSRTASHIRDQLQHSVTARRVQQILSRNARPAKIKLKDWHTLNSINFTEKYVWLLVQMVGNTTGMLHFVESLDGSQQG